MNRHLVLSLSIGALGLAGCSALSGQADGGSSSTAGVVEVPAKAPKQLDFKLASGTYRCEYGAQVEVRRDVRDPNQIRVAWRGNSYAMLRNASFSGLPRYEDAASGLVWIDLPWKSVLLDSKSGKPLVSECRSA